MNSQETAYLENFARKHDIAFYKGNINGRQCVGLTNKEKTHYVQYNPVHAQELCSPWLKPKGDAVHAYYKGNIFAVIVKNYDYDMATRQLARWIKRIEDTGEIVFLPIKNPGSVESGLVMVLTNKKMIAE